MKYISAGILLIALLVQTGSRYFVMLDFEINKDFIAKNLCVNKDKPKCCCHGKCYLKKQLDKADNEQNSTGNTSQKDQQEVLFFAEEKSTLSFSPIREINIKHYSHEYSFSLQSRNGSIFHPPQA